MFGVSFLEIALVALVALVVAGPQKLPGMMRATGEWVGKLRRLTSEMRAQTGIDDILREEGIDGVRELRTLLKGNPIVHGGTRSSVAQNREEPELPPELLDEFPVEGADAAGVLPDDLLAEFANATPDGAELLDVAQSEAQTDSPAPEAPRAPSAT